MIGIFRLNGNDTRFAAILDREPSGISGYYYSFNPDFNGRYGKNLNSDFNIEVDPSDERVQIILDDLKERAKTSMNKKRVDLINKVIEKYDKIKTQDIVDDSEIIGNVIFFNGNMIDITKLSYYDNDKRKGIIDGIEINIVIPDKIYEKIKDFKISKVY